MRVAFFVAAALGTIAASLGQQAHAADCDVDYVIQPGDTLSSIAQLAYGTPSYQLIFSANAGKFTSISNLPVGDTILIPCVPGVASMTPDDVALSMAMLKFKEGEDAAPAAEADPKPESQQAEAAPEPATQEPEVQAEAEPTQEEPAPESVLATAAAARTYSSTVEPVGNLKKLRLLSANGLPPFSDKSLRRGGMATELVVSSLAKLGILDKSRIVFIDDRDTHLKDLLMEGSFDIGFPWYRPACDQLDKLAQISPQDAWMCKSFIFSEPFYEFVYGFFVRKGEYFDGRATFADFTGTTICRPSGVGVKDLAVNGLRSSDANFVRPATLTECFDALIAGDVDAISGDAFAAEAIMARKGIQKDVEELTNLSLLQTVHAVAPVGKPGAAEAIESLNRALIQMKVSGEWFRVVGRHIVLN